MNTIHLEFASGPNAGQCIPLSNRTLIFGRTAGADVVLEWDGLVSSKHFKVQREGSRYILHDLESTNGTFVNGQPARSHELVDGDQIKVGTTVLTVKCEPDVVSAVQSKAYFNPLDSMPISIAPSQRQENERGGTTPPDQDASIEMKIDANEKEIGNQPDNTSPDLVGQHRQVSQLKASGPAQLRLRVISQKENGRSFWLSSGQTTTFGRTDRADCTLKTDPSLSSEHFRVSCKPDCCEIEDLKSRAGVWLNGKKISKSLLRHGDHVLAGTTEFSIEIDGVGGGSQRLASAGSVGSAVPSAKPRMPVKRVHDVSQSECASGLLRLRGKTPDEEGSADSGIVEVIQTLHAFAPLQLLIDFSRVSLPLPKTIIAAEHSLFEWMPSGAIEKTPMLFSIDEFAEWKAFVEEGWGSDAVIGLQSELPRPELLAKLQDILVGSSHGPEASRGILGFCWPSVLESLMENNSNGFVETFFGEVSSALIEVQGKPEQWQYFGKEAAIEKAVKMGMRIVKDSTKELAAS
ncbi:MAG: FHA domain-containing protein [Pirellulaceae bacterium]|nr:FHA domain-containing protein [Pirellulaceae bacterium]